MGPSLGAENVNSGLISFLVAIALVMLYMVLYYAGAGWVADRPLIVNLFVLMGSLASLQASLTLPGIAGIVLTMGMAVDANVLIFRTDPGGTACGRVLKSAVDPWVTKGSSLRHHRLQRHHVGHRHHPLHRRYRSRPWFRHHPGHRYPHLPLHGHLPVAHDVTARLEGRWHETWTGWSKNILADTNFDFMGKRKLALVSWRAHRHRRLSMVTRGFNWGVDFSGGRTHVVKFQDEVNVENVRQSSCPGSRPRRAGAPR